MEHLLSGLIGALIASLLTVVYLYISTQSKLRAEVLLEVVGYCDDIYHRLQSQCVHKKAKYTKNEAKLTSEEYRYISNELSILLKSTKIHAKLAIAYGESDTLGLLNQLSANFRGVASILWKATKENWDRDDKKISQMFKTTIDPLRDELQKQLIKGMRAGPIIQTLFSRMYQTFCKSCQNKQSKK